MNKRQELHPTLARASPIIFFYLIIFNCIISPSYNSFYLLISYYVLLISNWITKHLIVKQLYELFNKTSIPILGLGPRPANAHSCDFILNNINSTSYGMPSGHSQTTWAIATYLIFKIIVIWYKKLNTENKAITSFQYIWLILSCIIILLFAIYISYSRVYIEGCHTIQQVIVGGLLGVVCGFLIYYFENDVVKLMTKIY
jgi:membrane-associated phospholipid phosphatase